MKTHKYRIWIVILILLAGTCVAALLLYPKNSSYSNPYAISEDNKLTIYTSHKKEVYEPIIKEFEDRTGIWVDVVSGGTTEMLDRIQKEKEAGTSSCDVMFGGGVDSLDAYSEYFMPYRASGYDKIDKLYVSDDDRWTSFSKLPIVFIYNDKLVYSEGVPKQWSDLLSERWQGNIAFADPRKSGTSYTALVTMMQILGNGENDDAVLSSFIDNLDGKISSNSGAVLSDVESGSSLIGVTLEEAAKKRIAAGANIGIVYPEDGTSAVPDGTAIIEGCTHETNAKLFIDFTLSDDVQNLLKDQCYRLPIREDIVGTDEFKEINYDLNMASDEQETILDAWAKKTDK